MRVLNGKSLDGIQHRLKVTRHSTAAPLPGKALAGMHRRRWTVERAFPHLTVLLRGEVNTLGYPPAALFALACAMVVFNVLGVVKAAARATVKAALQAALRAAHVEQVQPSLSSHAMATHMRAMAQWLLVQATLVSPKRCALTPARNAAPKPPPSAFTTRESPMSAWPNCSQAHLEITCGLGHLSGVSGGSSGSMFRSTFSRCVRYRTYEIPWPS